MISVICQIVLIQHNPSTFTGLSHYFLGFNRGMGGTLDSHFSVAVLLIPGLHRLIEAMRISYQV
jgi:hypothetical protein